MTILFPLCRWERGAKGLLLKGDHAALVDYESLGRDALLSAPTPDHYLPLLYVIGSNRTGDVVSFPSRDSMAARFL